MKKIFVQHLVSRASRNIFSSKLRDQKVPKTSQKALKPHAEVLKIQKMLSREALKSLYKSIPRLVLSPSYAFGTQGKPPPDHFKTCGVFLRASSQKTYRIMSSLQFVCSQTIVSCIGEFILCKTVLLCRKILTVYFCPLLIGRPIGKLSL